MAELVEQTDGWSEAERYGQELAVAVLDSFGAESVIECRRDCPVSDISEPGYVHMIDTITYEVDPESLTVTTRVDKEYASWVNGGTWKMLARPFFTNGMQRATDRYEEIAMRATGTGPAQSTSQTSGGPSVSSPVAMRRPANPLRKRTDLGASTSSKAEGSKSPLRAKQEAKKKGV